jgi:hypothetical protein
MTKTRTQKLGDFGEDKALQLLKPRYDEIEKMPPGTPFFDLRARKGSQWFLFPVKTRNKRRFNGKLKKDNYNLYPKEGHYESACKIASSSGAEIRWVAMTVDTTTKSYRAYMGDVSKLPSPKYIPMHPDRDVPKHECLTSGDVFDEEISASWSNRRLPD